jgi:opacity protein-like surface antigen
MKRLVAAMLLFVAVTASAQNASIKDFCKQLEGKHVYLKVDVVRIQYALNGTDTTNILPGPEVSYRAKAGNNAFRQIQASSAEDFAEEARIANKGIIASVRRWEKGTEVTIHNVNVESDQVQMDVTEKGGSKSRIRFNFEKNKADYTLATVRQMYDFTFAATKDEVGGKTLELSLGMSIDEVTKLKGSPKSRVNLGSRVVLAYDDMKLTFEDGKLTDVQ